MAEVKQYDSAEPGVMRYDVSSNQSVLNINGSLEDGKKGMSVSHTTNEFPISKYLSKNNDVSKLSNAIDVLAGTLEEKH